MSTPGGYDPNAGNSGSNPYGGSNPPPPPGGSNPYGGSNPPPPPGGSNPYGGGSDPYGGSPTPYGAPGSSTTAAAPMDGVSIGALVTAVLCCTGPVGVVLGIVGILRTKDGQRRGRWMAVVGIVVGLLATLSIVGIAVFGFWFNSQVITPANAEVGQCIDFEDGEDDAVILTKKDCTEDHDGEILYVGEYDPDDHGDELDPNICAELVDQERVDAATENIDEPEWRMVSDDPGNESSGDGFVCYVTSDDKLDEPLL